LRKRDTKIVYVHVPKTGGTSMWACLTKAFPAHAYYPNTRAYLSNPPEPDDYDLIGLHFSPTVLSRALGEEHWVIGMLRDPTQRFLSGVMHARRQTEDPETFTASARAMREMELRRYLSTPFGRFEARLQLITFGLDYRDPVDAVSDEEMLRSALTFAQRENVVLAPSERSHDFPEFLAKRLSFRPGALDRLNANQPAMRAAHFCEFNRAVGLIDAINAYERKFYDLVCHSFSELYRKPCSPRRSARQRHWSTPLAGYVRAG
jgi:hypothetical protein